MKANALINGAEKTWRTHNETCNKQLISFNNDYNLLLVTLETFATKIHCKHVFYPDIFL